MQMIKMTNRATPHSLILKLIDKDEKIYSDNDTYGVGEYGSKIKNGRMLSQSMRHDWTMRMFGRSGK